MTTIGNPQNMLIGVYSGWTYGEFLLWMAPVGGLGLAVLIGFLFWFYGASLTPRADNGKTPIAIEPPEVDRVLLRKSLAVLAGVLVAFVTVGNLPLVAISSASLLLVISNRPPALVLSRVNWVLLAFFAGLFIVVHGLARTGLVAEFAAAAKPMYGSTLATEIPVFSALTVLASNVVSNVPFVVLAREIVPGMVQPDLMWLVLAMASTLAGNLTIPGSVATLIVLETARRHDPRASVVGFFEFLRIGVPVTIATTTLGALVLAAEHWIASS
jgi:Na+/H+ antiporter NhaD/arsenite permease-like protein